MNRRHIFPIEPQDVKTMRDFQAYIGVTRYESGLSIRVSGMIERMFWGQDLALINVQEFQKFSRDRLHGTYHHIGRLSLNYLEDILADLGLRLLKEP